MPWKSWPQPWAQGWENPYGKYPKYQQPYPIFQPQYFPQHVQPTQPQNPNPEVSLSFPQRPNQLPTQPLSNPNNNKNSQPVYNMEGQNFQTYMILHQI